MVYINSTTATFIIAGLGATAYYLYSNVIEPHQKTQRELQAEQAQKELLEMEEEEQAKRGINKQAAKKKQALATSHQKKEGRQKDDDRGTENINEIFETSNLFDLLDTPAASTSVSGRSLKNQTRENKKTSPIKKASSSAAPATLFSSFIAMVPEAVNTNGKEMEHMAAMNRKERRKVASAALDDPAQVQEAYTETTKNAQSLKGQQEMAREPEILCAPEPAMLTRDGSARDIRHPHALASLDLASPAKSRGSSNTASALTSTLLMSSSSSIEMMTVTEEVFEKVVSIERAVPNHELAKLQALLKAKEHALIAADARFEEANHRILELQKRVEADAEAVKVAKKTETKAQKREERLESLTFTNSLLVQQLTLERENQSAAETNPKQGDNTRVTELEARVEDLEQRRTQARAQIKQLQELDQEKRQELNEAERRADAAMEEKEEIHRQAVALLSEKDERIAILEKDLAALEGELEAARMQVEQYVDAVEHLEAVSRTQCESLESEKRSLFEETEMLRTELAEDSEMRKRQETELRRTQKQLSKIESKHSECAAHYDEILVVKEQLLLELAKKTHEFEAMMEGKAVIDARLEAFIQESKEKRMELEEECDVLSLRVVELEHQLASFQQKETRKKSEAEDIKASETFEIQVASEPKQDMEVEYLEQEEEQQPFSVQLGVAIATF